MDVDDRPVLDWKSRHDPASLNFAARATIGERVARRVATWQAHPRRLNQRREGACVMFAWTNDALARPVVVGGRTGLVHGQDPELFAREQYQWCLRNDEFAGEADEGTSVLTGAKAMVKERLVGEYRWAFGIDDVIDVLCSPFNKGGGPVIFGIPWLESMFEPRRSGLLEVHGYVAGGHAIMGNKYHPNMRLRGEPGRYEVVGLRQSWGAEHGVNGDIYIKVEDLAGLLSSRWGAESCVATRRLAA